MDSCYVPEPTLKGEHDHRMRRKSEQHELQAREGAARAEVTSLRAEVESLRAEAGAARAAAESARVEGEAARSRFSFLAEASRVLGTSLDYETTLRNLARL